MGRKRRKINPDDSVIKDLMTLINKPASPTETWKSTSKTSTISYRPQTHQQRNRQRQNELNWIRYQIDREIRPELEFLDAISRGQEMPFMHTRTNSQREQRRMYLYNREDELNARRQILESDFRADDEIDFDEVTSGLPRSRR